ncbi:TPR_REGION domain-containing protein [Psidium guajava]|nr:TPR_REGION domain-containing protein [Psidium guajava]
MKFDGTSCKAALAAEGQYTEKSPASPACKKVSTKLRGVAIFLPSFALSYFL